MRKFWKIRFILFLIALTPFTKLGAQSMGKFVLTENDTLLCFDRFESIEIANFRTLYGRDTLRLNVCLKREKSLEGMIDLAEYEISQQDSLIAKLYETIILGENQIDDLNTVAKKNKREGLVFGVLGGLGLAALLNAFFGR